MCSFNLSERLFDPVQRKAQSEAEGEVAMMEEDLVDEGHFQPHTCQVTPNLRSVREQTHMFGQTLSSLQVHQ